MRSVLAVILRFTSKSMAACWRAGLTAGLALLLTGCATCEKCSLTYRLWDSSDFRQFNEPAPEPNLALFEVTNRADVLVQYDAITEKRSAVKRQAYDLRANHTRIVTRQKPKFAKPSDPEGMKPIPIFAVDSAMTNAPEPPGSPYAVTGNEGRSFTLYQQSGRAETIELPVYQESSGTAIRVALTPLAVAADTVVVAAAASVVFLEGLAQSHSSFTIH